MGRISEEAYEQIIQPMSEVKSVVFKKSGRDVGVTKWQMDRCEERELLDEFYDTLCPKYLDIQFMTPTAFKQDGRYVIYPDLRLIYGSLMRKYSAVSGELDMIDEDLLNHGKDQYYGICGEYQYSCTWPRDAGQICAVIVEIWRIFRCGYQDRHGNGGHAI